jgi:SAM-dependent methyltransferase
VRTFAEVGDKYIEELSRGLSLTGEGPSYYASHRVGRVRELCGMMSVYPRSILDFGCGIGLGFPPLRSAFPDARLVGFEPERELRAVAVQEAARSNAEVIDDNRLETRGDADIVYCNGVFHHIPVAERADAMQRVRGALRPGGLAFIWENSPFNPGTRWSMSRIEFDRDAVLMTPGEMRDLQRSSGLAPVRTEFHFIFPRVLRAFRPLERMLRGLPLGGQYVVVGRVPA